MTGSLLPCTSCQRPLPFGASYCPVCGQPQTNAGSLSMGERRLVTILFADLASFTAVSENSDPEDVIDMLNYVFTRLMVECDREGGYLDKTVGDQLMILFGAPKTHEDDPVRAVRAALAMQAAMEELAPVMREKVGAACKLNIGIHTGNVVWGQAGPTGRTAPTVIGDAVNLACRLQQAAKDGQVLVSEAVYLRARRLFEFKVLDPIKVKNKSGIIPVFAPLHPHQRVTATSAGPTDTRIPLVERDQELQMLHAYWSQASAGSPQIVLLRGDAGLGKSHLLTEFANGLDTSTLDKQPLVLHTYCKSTTDGAFNPLSNLLYQLFGLTADDTDLIRRRKVEDRARILGINENRFLPLMGYLLGWYQNDTRLAIDSLREFALEVAGNLFLKQSTHRPVMLIIDDLQRTDAETVKWLNRLAAAKEAVQRDAWRVPCRLMVLVASRPQADVLTQLVPIETMILTPLSETARRDLIGYLLPGRGLPLSLVERLSRESEGNPFYLVEAARGIIQSKQLVRQNGVWHLTRPDSQIEMPQSVEGLMMANLDALDPITRNVLQHAAVIGPKFSYSLLAAITPVEELDQHLADLEQRGLIVPDVNNDKTSEKNFAFNHLVMREVTYQSILRKTRRELHQRIAELTETEDPSDSTDLKSLAHHYAAGGDREKLVAYNWLAGQHSLDEANFEEAYHHLQLAWNVLKDMSQPNTEIYQKLAVALGDASTFTGKFALAVMCYQVVQEMIGDHPEELPYYYYRLGRLHFYQADAKAAHEYYEQALSLAASDISLKSQIEAELRLLYDMG